MIAPADYFQFPGYVRRRGSQAEPKDPLSRGNGAERPGRPR